VGRLHSAGNPPAKLGPTFSTGCKGLRDGGATLTPDVGDRVLSPGETVTVGFVIGLQTQAPFTFFVELFGEPVL
jgi:hypothetical protein